MFMKKASIVALFFFIIIAPLISFLYLRGGINFRKSVLEEIKVKSTSPSEAMMLQAVSRSGRVCLIHTGDSTDTGGIEILKKIDEQIVERKFFDLVTSVDSSLLDSENQIDFVSPSLVSGLRGHQFWLIDTSRLLRYKYSYEEDQQKKLIKHLAVLLPMEPRREIKLRREMRKEKE